MRNTVTVRLRYTVTGSLAAAKQELSNRFSGTSDQFTAYTGADYRISTPIADIDPDEVSGYSNYPTFHVALFLSNSKKQYDKCRILAKNALQEENPRIWLADVLREKVEDHWLVLDRREAHLKWDVDTLAFSLIAAALGQVDWLQLADAWITTAKEELAATAGNPA